jgi:hypothetical protein
MNQADQKKMREQVLTLAVASFQSSTTLGITASTSSLAAALPGPTIFMLTVPVPVPSVFQVSLARCTLPIQIQASFLHITLQLGAELGCSRCPATCCVIDTAAALSSRNLHFFAPIAKAYPHTATAIHS